ncbi:RING finger protein 17-like [Liolophura sinensis]|uniref:RING finger protein 17-like n=1 Tax=Liolophura sinensis TaxID=3198878 RepID=UPI00315860F3
MHRNPVCPSCSHSFSIRDSSHMHNTKQPLLLQCGHACCENCLNKSTRTKKDHVACVVCQSVTDLSHTEKGVKSLQPDVYINGVLYINRSSRLDIELKRLTPAGSVSQKLRRDVVTGGVMKSVICSECKINMATCRCIKCASILCGICFEKIHGGFNILRTHQASELDSDVEEEVIRPSTSRLMCVVHNKQIEYHCEVDNTLVCSTCVISGDHKSHEVTSMEDKNKTYVDELESLVQTASRVLKRLKISEKSLKQTEPDYTNDLNRLVGEVKSHFRWLHGCLQIREMEIINEIMANINSPDSEKSGVMQDMRSQLKQAQTHLTGLIQDAKKVINNYSEVVLNGKDILDRLVEATGMPCTLVSSEKPDQCELKVEWSSDIQKAIQNHGAVVGSLEPTVTLVTLSESGPDVSDTVSESGSVVSSSVCDSDVIIEEENEETLSLSETASTTSRSLSRQSSAERPRNKPRSERTSRRNDETREVEVTHIKSPSCFLVQQTSDMRDLTHLQKIINKWCRSEDSQKHRPEKLSPGDLVLACYSQDQTWYRARVKHVVTKKSDKDNPDKEVLVGADVVYFDFGNSEVVPVGRLLKMQARFMKHPEFAIECCLYDIVYLEGQAGWSPEAVQTLFEMTNGKKMTMHVIQEVNNVLHVDLCKPPNTDIRDDCAMSVRDALVFMELANYYSQSHPSVTPIGYTPKRQFIRPEPKNCRETFEAVISHCNSPDSFYVQELGIDSHYLYTMMMEMQELYSNDSTGIWNILCPQKGMVCAALFDCQWRRARVVDHPQKRMVQVQYVDFGNTGIVPALNLKKLLDRFLYLPTFAIHCQLADVIPVEEEGWTPKAYEWCKRVLDGTKCSATVIKRRSEKLHLQLVAVIEDIQYCVNWKLVRDKLAVSTGKSSKLSTKTDTTFMENNPFVSHKNIMKAEADSTSDTGNSETSETRPKKVANRRKKDRQEIVSSFLHLPHSVLSSSITSLPYEGGDRKDLRVKVACRNEPAVKAMSNGERHEARSTPSDGVLTSSQKDSTEEEVRGRTKAAKKKLAKKKKVATPPNNQSLKVVSKPASKSPIGLQIVVTHCESPGKIYLQMATALQDGLEGLMKAMKETYARVSPAEVSWKPGDYCAAKRSDDRWYRGRIEKKISESKMEVFMEDFGFTEEMDTCDLQGLSDVFIKNYGSFCQLCHIADILPTGDVTKWSQTAVEFVCAELRKKTCFLVKKGEKDESGSQPIDLLIEVLIQESALEPASRDYYSLCEKLKEKGLAMPVRRKVTKTDFIKENPAAAALAALTQTREKPAETVTSPTSPTSPIVEPHILLKPPCAFYKPGELPDCTSLTVIPTFVDYGCIIYVHVLENGDTDQLLTESMQTYFNQPTLYGTPTEWVVGQACAAYYSVDQNWYRAKVIELPVTGDQLRVRYIDYGNSVWLSRDQVRADVNQFVDIPTQAFECVLHQIKPLTEDDQGIWPTGVVELVHDLLVNKECIAVVEEVLDDGQLSVDITLPDGTNLSDLLISENLAVRFISIEEMAKLSNNILEVLKEKNPFDLCDLPGPDTLIPIVLTHVEMPDVVYFQRGRPNPEETDSYSQKVSKELTALEKLFSEINTFAPTALLFEKPRSGAPCCAQYSADHCWYRALMISVQEDKRKAYVCFVDFGNSEYVSFDRLRIMPAQFMILPAQACRCHISNIAPSAGQSWNQATLDAMLHVVKENMNELKAWLISVGPQCSAILYRCEEELVYQSLIDQGLIVLKTTDNGKMEKSTLHDWGDMVEDEGDIDYQNKLDLGSSSTDTTLDDKSEELSKVGEPTSSDSVPKTHDTGGDSDSSSDDNDKEWETTSGDSEEEMESNV